MKFLKNLSVLFVFIGFFFVSLANAATEFTTTVNTDGGGDYSSLSLWEAAINSDIATSTTKVIGGSLTRGSFADGVAVTQTISNATGTMLHDTATQIMLISISGAPNSTGTWWPTTDGNDATNAWTPTDAGDSVIARVNASGTTADTTTATIDGWTTSATNFIDIRGNYAAASGVHYSTNYYRIEKTNNTGIVIGTNTRLDIFFTGIQIQITSTGGGTHTGFITSMSAGVYNLTFDRVIVKGVVNSGGTGTHGGFYLNDIDVDEITVRNSIAYGFNAYGTNFGFIFNTLGTITGHNLVSAANDTGFRVTNGTATFKNSASFNNTTDWGGGTITYSVSDDTQAGTGNIDWTNEATDWSANFVDYANGDFHLKSASGLIGAGTDLYGSGVTTDVDNDTLTVRNDIGADEYNYPPSPPSSFGSSSFVEGSWTASTTPQLTFSLTDSSPADTVKYQIQISTSSTFATQTVDYASALAATGTVAFTVGQVAGSGSYTTGSASQTLPDNSYYWRVMATDNNNATSSWANATSSGIAFKVDATAPVSVSVVSITADSSSQLTVVATSTDAGSGLHSTPYWFAETSVNSGASSSTDWQASISFIDTGLSVNTQYTYQVRAKDSLDNTSTYSSTSSKYTLANVPAVLSVSADSISQLTASWTANSNPSGTSYYIENTTASANSGWQTTLSWSSASLSCNTSYSFRVKARNGDSVETSWSDIASQTTNACRGGGMPLVFYNPPTAPEGGFKILINNGVLETSSSIVRLNFIAGSNTTTMAISNFSDFRNVGQEIYQSFRDWDLCKGKEICSEGGYTVYAKFYAPWGKSSEVVSDSIGYQRKNSLSRSKTESVLHLQETTKQLQQELITLLIQLIKLLQEKIKTKL